MQELLTNNEYKITGVTAASITKGVGSHSGSLSDGTVQVETEGTQKKKEIKPYMLKDKKEVQAQKDKFKQKLFKKGGRKKRKVKS